MKEFWFMEMMTKYGFNYIVVKYENLIDLKHPDVQINELQKMLKYLYSDYGYERNEEMLMKRMECFFPFLMGSDYQRLGKMHRQKPNETQHVTMDMAYGYLMENYMAVICLAWNMMKEKAMIYGYENLPGVTCQEVNHTFSLWN